MLKRISLYMGIALALLWGAGTGAAHAIRVEQLVIEKHVARHIGKAIELTALAPGSGWLRIRTPNGLGPVLSFDAVTEAHIECFNRFSEAINYPFRVMLEGSVLHIRHNRNRVLGKETVIDPKATRIRGFFQSAAQPSLMVKKTESGKVQLVRAEKESMPERIPGVLLVSRDVSKYRKIGFKIMQKGFSKIDGTPGLEKSIHLKDVRIRIVGSRNQFNEEAQSHGNGVLGYATSENEITVLGKMVDGRLVVNQAVLGHELNHLLNYANRNVANPDDLDEYGL